MKTKGIIFDMDGTLLESMHIWQPPYDYRSLLKSYKEDVELKDGAFEFLNSLRSHGIRMVLATATDRFMVEPAIKRNKIDSYFEIIFTCSEVGVEKHNPKIYHAALDYLGLEKDEVWVFEDAHYAVTTAKRAGFNVVGVYDRWARNQSEIALLSDIFIKSFRDIGVEDLG